MAFCVILGVARLAGIFGAIERKESDTRAEPTTKPAPKPTTKFAPKPEPYVVEGPPGIAPPCIDEVSNCKDFKDECKTSTFTRKMCRRSCTYCPKMPTAEPPRPPMVEGDCGMRQVDDNQYVVAGDDAEKGAWPWQVSL